MKSNMNACVRARALHAVQKADDDDGEVTFLQKVIDTLGTVLTYNFFIICGFFLWFLTGVGA